MIPDLPASRLSVVTKPSSRREISSSMEWLRVEISRHIVVQNLTPVIHLFGAISRELAGASIS